MSNIILHWTKDKDGRHWDARGERGAYQISLVPDIPIDGYYGFYHPDPKRGRGSSKPFERLSDAQQWAEDIEHGKLAYDAEAEGSAPGQGKRR